MKRIKFILLSLGCLLFLIGVPTSDQVYATEGQVGYSVQAILPENQKDPNVSYFDLQVVPGQQQELQVEIFNHENTELTVEVTPTVSSTNRNGLVVYEEQEAMDDSLMHPLPDLMEMESNTITVPAAETEVITLRLTAPEKSFDGVILGGLHFEKVPDEDTESSSEGVSIENRYAYVIGVQLSQTDEVIEPELNLKAIEPSLVNYRTAVIAQIQNPQPLLMGGVHISAQVFEAEGTEPIKESTMEDVSFAPNSTMDYVINWDNQYLEPGDYRLEMTAVDSEENWEWSEPFTITEEASLLSEDAVELEEGPFDPTILYVIIGVLIVIIIGLVIYVLKKGKSHEKK